MYPGYKKVVPPKKVRTPMKIALVGSGGCGKTSYIDRVMWDKNPTNYIATIGMVSHRINLKVDEDFIPMEIWDTAGQTKFAGNRDDYYSKADTVIIMFDAQDPRSLSEALQFWHPEIVKRNPRSNIMFCSTKTDDENCKISTSQCNKVKEYSLPFFEVSAKTDYNLYDPLISAARAFAAK